MNRWLTSFFEVNFLNPTKKVGGKQVYYGEGVRKTSGYTSLQYALYPDDETCCQSFTRLEWMKFSSGSL